MPPDSSDSERREPLTISHDDFDAILASPNPVGKLFGLVEWHFYGMRADPSSREHATSSRTEED